MNWFLELKNWDWKIGASTTLPLPGPPVWETDTYQKCQLLEDVDMGEGETPASTKTRPPLRVAVNRQSPWMPSSYVG